MKIDVCIDPSEAAKEFAVVTLRCGARDVESVLDLDFSALYDRCKIPNPVVLDLLFLASVVYGVDKLVSRKETDDRWTRLLELSLPVSDPEKWSTVINDLETCLTFLTGDVWNISFTEREDELYIPKQRKRPRRKVPPPAEGDTVCLFSGGLDSLVGAIDYLKANPSNNLFLVGHRDGAGPKSDQERLSRILKKHYPSRFDLLQLRVGHKLLRDKPKRPSSENTLRSRSFLFIALGMYVAHFIGKQISLLMPENGAIALNMPLTPARRGSCSTRTAHPFLLNTLREVLDKLGIENPLCNPLELKTKGECVQQCLDQDALHATAKESVSCAKRSHKRTWKNKESRECGKCLPCIYRRASLHKVGLDNGADYGRDICEGDVNLDCDKRLADDLRALLSFLRRDISQQEIACLLLANGNIKVARLHEYADIVARSMNEVRNLLQDKGNDEIKRRAGLVS